DYDSSADFYVYNSHYKASSASDDPANPLKRNTEATAIRANYNTLPKDGNNVGPAAIYAGDHNFYDASDEPAVTTLMAAGNGAAIDPLNRVGDWDGSSAFKDVHTQSPTTVAHYGGQVTGGMDSRFDFQWITGAMNDHEGVDYIAGSYHAYGNNGTTY